MTTRWPLQQLGRAGLIAAAAAVDLIAWAGDSALWNDHILPLWLIPVVTLLLYPTLWLRDSRPLLVLAIFWCFGFASLLIPQYQPFAGLLLALFAVARHVSKRLAIAAVAASLVPFAVDSIQVARTTTHHMVGGLATFAIWVVVTMTIWGFGRLILQVERRGELLRRLDADRAVQEERIRLARELHDIVAHAVSAMLLQAAGARTVTPAEAVRTHQALELIESTGVQAMEELHRLLFLLRSDATPQPDDLWHLAALDRLADVARQSGLSVKVHTRGRLDDLDPSVDLAGYRVVQEGLTNATKHAGKGAECTVRVQANDASLDIEIRDHVPGPRQPADNRLSAGLGLAGLRERVQAVGGDVGWTPATDGFCLEAHIPFASPL